MKNALKITIFSILFLGQWAFAQEVFRINNTPKGIFVEFGRVDFVGREFDLMRKTGDGQFKKIASLDAPNRENQLKRRIEDAEKIFIEDARPNEKNIDKTWKDFKDKKPNLNKIIAIIPQLEYVFGLAYFDDDVKPNEKYQYQLIEKKNILATSKTIIYVKYHKLPSLLMSNQIKQGADIRMEFNYPSELQIYSQFDVKRKKFSEQNTDFQIIKPLVTYSTKNRLTMLALTDTTLRDFSAYNYQIRIGDIFGNLDSTTHRFEANNVPQQLVSLPEKISVVAQKEQRNLLISWSLLQKQNLQSLKLFRSRDFDKDYRLIATIDPSEMVFEDKIEVANELYHYYFEATDLFGNTNRTFKFKGIYDQHTAPKKPTNLTVKKAEKGVELSWETSESFIRGYYVYRRKGKNGEFLQVSPFIKVEKNQPIYIDTGQLESEMTYFYSVKSESDTYDKSPFSDAVSYQTEANAKANPLKPPFDLNVMFRDNKLMLTWENLNTTIPQVLGYQVFRKGNNQTAYQLLTPKPLSFRQNYYQDSTFLSEGIYQFVVVSTDLRNNFSEQSQPAILDLNNRFVMTPENVGVEVLSNEIKLKWTSIETDRIKNLKIYRAEENADYKLISTIQKDKLSYSDTSISKGKSYKYRISSIDLNNKESDKSEAILVEL